MVFVFQHKLDDEENIVEPQSTGIVNWSILRGESGGGGRGRRRRRRFSIQFFHSHELWCNR
jgi:hypothetical protein